jgi:hypothetical protein
VAPATRCKSRNIASNRLRCGYSFTLGSELDAYKAAFAYLSYVGGMRPKGSTEPTGYAVSVNGRRLSALSSDVEEGKKRAKRLALRIVEEAIEELEKA